VVTLRQIQHANDANQLNDISVPAPWPTLRGEATEAIARIVVSHRPDHNPTGRLARLLVADLATNDGFTILSTALHTAAQSLARSLLDQTPDLILPTSLFPVSPPPEP